MSITFTIHPSKNLIATTAVGEVNYNDLLHYYDSLTGSPDYYPGLDEIFDLSEAVLRQITAEDVRQFSQLTMPDLPSGQSVRVAVIASGDLEFAIARMFQMHIAEDASQKVRVFRNRRDAEAWIDVTPD